MDKCKLFFGSLNDGITATGPGLYFRKISKEIRVCLRAANHCSADLSRDVWGGPTTSEDHDVTPWVYIPMST